MAHSLQISDADSKSELINELSVSRFKNLGRKHFHFGDVESRNFLKYFTNSAKFFHFNLHSGIDELFLRFEEADYFWALNSRLNNFLRGYYKKKYDEKANSDFQNNIRNLYNKWIKIQSAEEKKHIALLIISSLNKIESDDIYNLFIHANILIFEHELNDPIKADEILEKAFELTEIEDFNEYSMELRYLVRMYQGFLHFNDKSIFEANQKFSDALNYKNGISALFYKAVTDIYLSGSESVNVALQSIIEYDFKRISFGLESNNLSVYNYFLINNIISGIFNYLELADYSDEIENFFNEQRFGAEEKLSKFLPEFDKFRNLRMDDLNLDEFRPAINFIQNIIHSDQTHKNLLYYTAVDLTEKKFKTTIKSIYDYIVNKNYSGIEDKLNYFDAEIEKIKAKIEKFSRDGKSLIEKIKKEAKENISEFEAKIEYNLNLLDNRLNNLNLQSNYNPVNAFKNSLTYSFVISLLIFLVAGMASYSNVTSGDTVEVHSSLYSFIAPGVKWGSITFLLGFLFAIFSSISAIMERSTQKQRIVQRISFVKNQRERQIKELEKKKENDIKTASENLSEIKKEYEAQIEKFKNDKIEKEAEIRKETDERIRKESEPIKPFLIES
jgi:biopolymer transport protein ExbB/TolQ